MMRPTSKLGTGIRIKSYRGMSFKNDNKGSMIPKLYDKRQFFHRIISNIPSYSANDVYILSFIRYSRASCSYQDLPHQHVVLRKRLFGKDFNDTRLRATLHFLIVSVPKMTNGILVFILP